ncbi:MAG TPA: putative quinol monooxygenase [Puia sp.]|nr:putative quinol monooxygenase [Puia sp.]
MKVKWFYRSKWILIIIMTSLLSNNVSAQNHYMRIAKVVIDSAQLENYKIALKEGIHAAVTKEPGVLSLNAVYDKAHPTHVTVFEIYANEEAYKAHTQTAHFKKYKETVKDMVKSLELTDVLQIALESKMK